jgi:hypothetical protein
MDLDELQRRWQEQDAKLDAVLRLNGRLLAAPKHRRAKSALARTAFAWGFEALLNVLVLAWLASYSARHLFEPRFYVPAAWLALGAVLLVVAGVRQVAAIATLDLDAPVVAIQKRLERLRIGRIRALKWTLLLAPLAWTPMCIVGLNALFGFDAYAHLDTAYLAGNLIFGLLAIPAGLAIARFLESRVETSPWLRRIAADLGGRSLSQAARFLRAADDLERNPLKGL